mgnify:CR=1 FL=1
MCASAHQCGEPALANGARLINVGMPGTTLGREAVRHSTALQIEQSKRSGRPRHKKPCIRLDDAAIRKFNQREQTILAQTHQAGRNGRNRNLIFQTQTFNQVIDDIDNAHQSHLR